MVKRTTSKASIDYKFNLKRVKQSASDVVFDALREAIISGRLPAGTALIEAKLADEFGLSKTPIREALQRLTYSGLVDFELAKGASVHIITLDEVQHILEMQELLEPRALLQSAPLLTQSDLQSIQAVLEEAKNAIDQEDFQELSLLNNQFHEALYARAENKLLVKWLNSLSEKRRMIYASSVPLQKRSQIEWQEHQDILTAIQDQDYDYAAVRLGEHIHDFSNHLISLLLDDNKKVEE
ncbi:GntR family transcriptional regulator [Anaerolineales bacterium]